MEKELTAAVTTQEPMLADRLIVVQQLPVIKEQLHSIKAQAQASVAEALALVCTEETLKVVKEQRAKLNRDRKDLDARRMVVKNQIMQPFEDFDKVYKECVTDVYGPADEALKGKIADVEAGLKADKEKKVVAYFDELVKANGVEWVSYEDIGIAVTMTASLKSLKNKVKEYVDRVVADVNCINGMENAPEVMAEYKQCRNLAVAINSVSQRKDRVAREEAERKQRLEAQLRAQEAESAVLDAVEEELAAPRVMGTEPPVMDEQEAEETQQESKEQIMTAKFAFMGRTFQCHGTLTQLRELKSFVNEKIDEIQKHKFKNEYRVSKIKYTQKCRCFCPIGKADYTNNFTVTITPKKWIPDYCEIDKFIHEQLDGKSLVIEDAACKLKQWLTGKIHPYWVEVESDVTDGVHGHVTVTV